MSLIFLGLSALLIAVNVAGLALWLRPWLPHHAVAKVAAIVGGCLLLFFIEHFIGLGRLSWVWPLSTLFALVALYRARVEIRQGQWREELPFLVAFALALVWKFSFPNIDAHAEQLTDLSFIASYSSGVRLPPRDYWLPDQRLDVYYSFQHYGAALLGRIFGLTAGYAMNLATALLLALQASLIWFIAARLRAPRWSRGLLVYAVMLGGTGIAPLTHFIFDQAKPGQDAAYSATTNIWSNVRFAGMFDAEVVDNRLTRALFPKSASNVPARDLPLETIGYLTLQGEYHATQGGFLLLFFALACLALLEFGGATDTVTGSDRFTPRVAQALLAASVPLTLITNAWVFPLQAALLFGWLIYRYARAAPPVWPALFLGGTIALALAYPCISYLAPNALVVPIRWVIPIDHTPLDRFVAIHWPILALLALATALIPRQRYAAFVVIVFGALLLGSEWLYADDPMGEQYNRFNSVLKWWSWIYVAVLVGIGSLLLGAGAAWRTATAVILLLISTLSIDMARYWYYGDKSAMGKFSGHYWLTQDQVHKQILNWLAVAPPGVVLEGLGVEGAYTPTSALALFAGKPAAIGWPNHEAQWRGNPSFIYTNADQARVFYRGNLADAAGWLALNRVRYVVWVRRDQVRDPAARLRIQNQIGNAYDWKPFWKNGDDELGVWVAKE